VNSSFNMSTVDDATGVVFTSASWPDAPSESRVIQKPPRSFLWPGVIGLIMAVTSITAVADPWSIEQRRQTQPTSFVLVQSVGRRRITRAEALRLAQEILARAERERLENADWEAARGASWGEA